MPSMEANCSLEKRISPSAREGEGALRHVLHHDAVGFVGAFERIDAVAVRTRSHDGIHLAAAQGAQGFFGFLEAGLKLPIALEQIFETFQVA